MKARRNMVFIFLLGFCTGAAVLTLSSFEYKIADAKTKHFRTNTKASIAFQEQSSNDFKHLVEALQRGRHNTILNACQKWNQKFSGRMKSPNPDALYSIKYKFAVCAIPKCGQLTWLRGVTAMEGFFSRQDLTNKIVGDDVIEFARKNARFGSKSHGNQSVIAAWNKSTFRIITVRNPFHRLVSAYNDKMLFNNNSFYRNLSLHINRKFRHLRHDKANVSRDERATFEDFVHFVLSSERKDSNWRPFNVMCDPCKVTYDYVMKFETLKEDVKYLKEFLNLTKSDRDVFFPDKDFDTTDDIVLNHFRSVTKSLSLELYKHYKMDFDLFGYSRPLWL